MSTVYVLNKDGKPLMPTTRGGKYLQVVGHTPVKEVHLEDGVLSCDTFSTYRDGTPYGSQAFCIVDTITLEFETVKGG